MNNLLRLLNIVELLRHPEDGCEWDIRQTYSSIAPYTIEEVYEVVDAIDREDFDELKNELGDLLLQIVYYTQMAREENRFNFDDVAGCVSDKLVRRHPHVFDSVDEIKQEHKWEKIKHQERQDKSEGKMSVMDDIPKAMPQLLRSRKIQKRAAMLGFDWPEISGVIEKIEEELEELKAEMKDKNSIKIHEEVGDLLFSVVNLSRHLNTNAEDALRKSNLKFIARFQYIEEEIQKTGKSFDDFGLEELEHFWIRAKKELG